MAPRIVIIGGGSYQWVPKLVIDLVNTASLAQAEIVLHDIDPAPLPEMQAFVEHIAELKGVPMRASATTDRARALEGADFVVVTISTGGFASMRHDLEIPVRFGIHQSVGDTVGPGGISRALRNIPVLVDIARDMERICPDAWLLNLTNPMTTLCRAVTRTTNVRTIGLCHELLLAHFTLAQLLEANFMGFEFDLVGVNHLPFITGFRVDGDDGFTALRALLDDERRLAEPVGLPQVFGHDPARGPFVKRDLLRMNQVKLALFGRFGVWPGAGDRHLVEFFPGFLTEASEWGKAWGVELTTIADRERDAGSHKKELARLRSVTEVPVLPSGEIVAPLIDAFLLDIPRTFPLNLPNRGQAPDLPNDVVVETMGMTDGADVRGVAPVHAPPLLAEWLRRVIASQERTVDAASSGQRDQVVEAMLLDPFAGRGDFSQLVEMVDQLLDATAEWLPQFAS
ncbi:MAG TPA: hypothetical protein VFR41_15215 [Acidimicrobiia bacterium]|nr:hypothetical protein [Acidimicrobiia bacterium]